MSDGGRPEVTVSDPASPRPAGDVLGDDELPSSRRPLLIVLAVVLVLLAVTGITNVRERRAADTLERDLAATVQLELEPYDGASVGSSDGGTASAGLILRVRNTGPRPLTFLQARLGDFVARRESEVAPGGLSSLSMQASFDCQDRPGLLDVRGPLLLDVRTGDGVERTVDLGPVPVFVAADQGRTLCGYLSPGESLSVYTGRSSVEAAELVLGLELGNQGRLPIELLDITVADGLSVRVPPGGLPLALPARRAGVGTVEVRLDVVVTLERCTPDLLGRFREPAALGLSVAGDRGTAPVDVVFTPEELTEWLRGVCPDSS